MLRTEAFTDPEQLQAFLSQLYVYLVDEMHVALNKARTTHTRSHDNDATSTRLLTTRRLPLHPLFVFVSGHSPSVY